MRWAPKIYERKEGFIKEGQQWLDKEPLALDKQNKVSKILLVSDRPVHFLQSQALGERANYYSRIKVVDAPWLNELFKTAKILSKKKHKWFFKIYYN